MSRCVVGLVGLVVLVVLVVVVATTRAFRARSAADVPPDVLHRVLRAGTYTGHSAMAPTDLYPHGLVSTHRLEIQRTPTGVAYTNAQTSYDATTRDVVFEAVREGTFDYKPHHGSQLFKNAKTYIDGRLVSSSHGHAVAHAPGALTFELSGAWHIARDEIANATHTLALDDDGTLRVHFAAPRSDEVYHLVS